MPDRNPLPAPTGFQKWLTRLVMGTAYVLGTSLCVRIIYLTSYAEMLQAVDVVRSSLLEGGLFATIIYMIRQDRAARAAKEVSSWVRQKVSHSQPQEDSP